MLNVKILSYANPTKFYTPNFQGKTAGDIKDMSYKNVLTESLKSTPDSDFDKKLEKIPDITSFEKAKSRISNLSRYLKEDMVGFVVPEYTFNGRNKGGYQWFEKGAEYLLRGGKRGATEKDFPSIAKNLYGLLALHDNYWKSDKFLGYLSTLQQTPAIKATQTAVKELQKTNISFKGLVEMYGYFSPLKSMDKLLNDGCAYTGEKLQFDDPKKHCPKSPPKNNASLDHIMPKSWGGPCEDYNYILASQEINTRRGNMDLISFLKGNN
ncbi:MAG: hypothetical protein WC197_06710 [Candidatus Gastranaerophilaceae bacterium]|jgi:hypothetical protein